MLGQGITPTGYDPVAGFAAAVQNVRGFLQHVRDVFHFRQGVAAEMPEHAGFIDQHCSARVSSSAR